MLKSRLELEETEEDKTLHTFGGADKKADELETLQEFAKQSLNNKKNKGGRPLAGESKATEKVAFHLPIEVKNWLETLTDTKSRTPNAVIKKMVMEKYALSKGIEND